MSRRLLLGICGGIAAYKAAELARLLIKGGNEVRCVMTDAACQFITPLTLQAISGHPVATSLTDPAQDWAMGHIRLARWADQIVIAPATADFIARLASGHCSDMLSAACLASQAPISIAPAMNSSMWNNPATQDNIALLRQRGIQVMGPGTGELACGESGPGRMLEPEELLQLISRDGRARPLVGKTVLVTAGPTREAIDPVRFISNRSSGKMGFAIAKALHEAGAQVMLISGPVALETPAGVTRVDVESALEMHSSVMQQIERHRPALFVACAAVADYRPALSHSSKIKKGEESTVLSLVLNPDILADVAHLPTETRPICIGFAAETDDIANLGEQKRQQKGVELLAANLVGGNQGGFEVDDNSLTLLWDGGHKTLPLMPKPQLARELTAIIVERFFNA